MSGVRDLILGCVGVLSWSVGFVATSCGVVPAVLFAGLAFVAVGTGCVVVALMRALAPDEMSR